MIENHTDDSLNDEKIIFQWKKWLLNKYIILTIVFLVWMFLFDNNSYFTHNALNKEINKLNDEKKYYTEKLTKDSISYKELKYNKDAREKYARENYFMKKNNEDIFIIVNENDTLK